MVKEQNTYLQSASFQLLENWSVQYLLESKFSYNEKYELTAIGDFLKRNKTPIDIEDDKEYKRVTIKVNNGGVFLRDIEVGKNIGTKKQFVISEGQFLLSKIDARNGAFGVVPEEVDEAIITGNFWTFDVDYSKINPHFLALITTTSEFIRFCQNASNGTTNRHYLQENLFLAQRIPLPKLSEQERILEAYNAKIGKAEEITRKVNNINKDVEDYLFNELGIKISPLKKSAKGMHLINFSLTSRWDTQSLFGNIPSFNSKYELVKFEDIILSFNKDNSGKSIRINSTSFPKDDFRFIGMENIEKEAGKLLLFQDVKGKEIKSQTLRVPEGFLLFGKLRPYLNKYWHNTTDYQNIICSSEFFVFDIKSDYNKTFFIYLLSSRLVQFQISDKTSGARMPRINEEVFFNLKIPMPPIEIQNTIDERITNYRIEQDNLKAEAIENRQNAIKEFENEIFQPCD